MGESLGKEGNENGECEDDEGEDGAEDQEVDLWGAMVFVDEAEEIDDEGGVDCICDCGCVCGLLAG